MAFSPRRPRVLESGGQPQSGGSQLLLIRKGIAAIIIGAMLTLLVGPTFFFLSPFSRAAIIGVGLIVRILGSTTLAVGEDQHR